VSASWGKVQYAQEKGLYVLVQSGESVKIAEYGGDLSGAGMARINARKFLMATNRHERFVRFVREIADQRPVEVRG
jgi:hypothetical protein